MSADVTLAGMPFDPAAEYDGFTRSSDGDGAIASFTGLTRPASKTGEAVSGLFLDHHPRMTLASMDAIAEEARRRFPITRLRVVHRCGAVAAGEPIVFVAAASAHRRAALEAVDYMMDRLKTDAVFWKREDGNGGTQWIEPTWDDQQARARWSDNGGN